MNQSRSIYKTDFVPYDWMQNNFSSNSADFCSPENVDDCVQYISEEFSALGYPSIYLHTSSCPSTVNCDIVALLNVTYELLGCSKDHAHTKDDLECRNQRLTSVLTSVNKENALLKENEEQMERKYRSVLERERQLKEKNEKLTQAIKNEKSEAKKLSSQLQQQKVAYQHEVHKCENSVNQLRTRLKQVIANKNPDKKVVSVSVGSSDLLQRNSKRGKWKTGTVAQSNMEEMHNSLISAYENRSQEMLKEITDYQLCFEYLESEMKDIIAAKKSDAECRSFPDVSLHTIWNGTNKLTELKERFKCLLCDIRESALGTVGDNLRKSDDENEAGVMLSITQDLSVGESIKKTDCAKEDSESEKDMLELERNKLHVKEKELAAAASAIEKEKSNLENQRLEVMKMAMQQDSSKSEWHRNLKSSPSFSVITTKNGLTAVPSTLQLRQCHSAPSQQVKTLIPLWNSAHLESSKELEHSNKTLHHTPTSTTTEIQDVDFPVSDLPKWASSCLDPNTTETLSGTVVSETVSNEDFDLSNISLSEEQNLARLKAAFDDMERRRHHPSC